MWPVSVTSDQELRFNLPEEITHNPHKMNDLSHEAGCSWLTILQGITIPSFTSCQSTSICDMKITSQVVLSSCFVILNDISKLPELFLHRGRFNINIPSYQYMDFYDNIIFFFIMTNPYLESLSLYWNGTSHRFVIPQERSGKRIVSFCRICPKKYDHGYVMLCRGFTISSW